MSSEIAQEVFSHIPDGWGYMRLVDCTTDGNISYGIVQPGQHTDDGIPIIRVNNVNNGQLELNGALKVAHRIEEKYKRTRLVGGEVLLTLVGSTGQSFVAPTQLAGWNVPRAIAVIRPKDEIGAEWINICLQSKPVQHFLDVRANTTVQKTLNLKDVRDIPIPLPPEGIKAKIESIAVSLQKKIKLNRQINQTLEHIAQAIFKSWFIDFEPVKAKIQAKQNGQDPERAAMCAISGKTAAELDAFLKASTPEHDAQGSANVAEGRMPGATHQQLTATTALFPDELEGSEIGPIPKGWEVNCLGNIVSELRRGISPKYLEDGGVQVVNQKCIRNHAVNFSLSRRNDPEKRKIVGRELQIGDVLINSTGVGTLGRLAPVRYLPETTVVDSHVTVVRGNRKKIVPAFLSEYLLSKEVLIENSGAGSTGQTELRKQVLEELKVCNPDLRLQKIFSAIVDPLYTLHATIEREQTTLASVRDGLLPKLLSGELSITASQSKTEAVA